MTDSLVSQALGLIQSPVGFAFMASACFGMSLIVVKRGLAHLDSVIGSVINISVTTVFYWALAPFLVPAEAWGSPGLWVFALMGLFHPVVSTMLSFEANHRMGATVSGTLSSTEPLFATGSAVIVLGETLGLEAALGTLAVVAGVMVLSWNQKGVQRRWPLWVVVFPFGAAVIRGFTRMGNKFGLGILPSPLTAALVAYTVSGVAVNILARVHLRRFRLGINRPGFFWFFLGGVLNGTAIFTLFTALNLGRVVVVAPIVATFPLFTIFFNFAFFRQEKLTRRVLFGVLTVVGGVALITANG